MKLSENQKGILFLSSLKKEISSAYNMCYAFTFEGQLEYGRFLVAVNRVLCMHEAFHIRITNDGTLENYYLAEKPERIDVRKSELALNLEYQKESTAPFELFDKQLIRLVIGKPKGQKSYFIFTIHHSIFDDSSANTFMKALSEEYAKPELNSKAMKDNKEVELNRIVQAEQQFLESDKYEELLRKSVHKLSEYPKHINWITNSKTDAIYRAGYLEKQFAHSLIDDITEFSKRKRVTKTALFMSVYIITIWHFSSHKKIPICFPISTRDGLNQDKIGYFTNMGTMASPIDSNVTFNEFIEVISDEIFDILDQRQLPFQKISQALRGTEKEAHGAYTQFSFNYINKLGVESYHELDGVVLKKQRQYPEFIKNQFKLDVEEKDDSLIFSFLYDSESIDKSLVQEFTKHYEFLLDYLCKHSDLSLAQVPLVNNANFDRIIHGFNSTDDSSTYEHDTVYFSFLKTAEAHANKVAICFGERTLTYDELLQKVERYSSFISLNANFLDKNISLIYLERSIEMIVSILACIRLGITFLPVSTESPTSRVRKLIQHSEANIIISTKARLKDIEANKLSQFSIEELNSNDNIDNNIKAINGSEEQAIYLMYTSGTTGEPKGILIPEIALRNRIKWMQSTYNLSTMDNVLQKTPISFDVSMWEVFWPLLTGAKLTLAEPDKHKDIHYLNSLTVEQNITHIHFVPSMFSEFVTAWKPTDTSALKQVFCSGEVLQKGDVEQFYEKLNNVGLANLYGPTETTIDSTYWNCADLPKTGKVLIGKPISNTCTYILNENLMPVPVGVEGDLYIAGLGLATGYLNNEHANREKFLLNPFLPNQRLYKTGDKASFTTDGDIEYMGREDDQIKIRGVRIELCGLEEEIKGAIASIDKIALKVYQDNHGEDALACYYTLKEAGQSVEQDYRSILLDVIPEYFMPSSFVELEQFSYTTSGKINRKVLPTPQIQYQESGKEEGFTEDEIMMKDIWEEVLGVKISSKEQDFFSLGGHSLLATKIAFKVKDRLGVELSVLDLFTQPTIQEICCSIRQKKSNTNDQLTFGTSKRFGLKVNTNNEK